VAIRPATFAICCGGAKTLVGTPLAGLGGEGRAQATVASSDSQRWRGDLQIL
jgi:hypothetical protein